MRLILDVGVSSGDILSRSGLRSSEMSLFVDGTWPSIAYPIGG